MPHFALAGVALLLWAPAVAFRVRPKKAQGISSSRPSQSAGGKVVTLGDSYSSGVGIHTWGEDYEGGDCWRDVKTTPGAKLAKNDGMEGVNVACAGSELPGVVQQFDQLQADYPEDAASGWAGSVIMFTIGGNDIRTRAGQSWPEILQSCIMSFYGHCHEEAQNQLANLDELQADLAEFYHKVALAAPNAKIRIMGYPRLLTRTWHCIPVPGLDMEAADWADVQVDEINRRLNGSVSQVWVREKGAVDIAFVDVKPFVRGGACWLTERKINTIVLAGLSISSASFHPNQMGYNKYYKALTSSLGRSESQSRMAGRMAGRMAARVAPDDDDDDDDDHKPQAVDHQESDRILRGWDKDNNGKLSIGEVLSMVGVNAKPALTKQLRSFFSQADKDQDDALNLGEFERFMDLVSADEVAR